MSNSYKIDLKLKTEAYEISELRVLKNHSFNLPISKTTQSVPILYVLEGTLQQSEGQLPIEKGEYLIIQNQDTSQNLCALENAKILMIASTPQLGEQNLLFDSRMLINTRASYGKAIANDILAAQPSNSKYIEALILTIKTKNPFEGNSFNVYSDLFLSIFTHLPLEPLKISKTYSAYLCAKWVQHALIPEKAIEEVIYYIEKLYTEIFMPNIQNPIVRNAIYWTLLNTDEKKSVQLIADKLYMNRTYLSERFKQLAHISLSDYILHIKMSGAMLLLMDKNLSQSDVIDILGYKDESHFVRTFKKIYNMTPNEFVKRYGYLGN